jgi:class 3 adenylate cyclase
MRDVQYARAGDGTHVAYWVLEPGADCRAITDIVMVSGGLIPVDLFEEDDGLARLLEGLRDIGRVVIFDRRGLGLSDPIVDWERPVLDQWADDVAAVVDASGAEDVVVFAWDGYGVGSRFVVGHPGQCRSLVLFQPLSVSDLLWDDWATRRSGLLQENLDGTRQDFLQLFAPSRASDTSFRAWYARAGRAGASPATARRIWESVFRSRPGDQLLSQVGVPTLVLHRRDNAYAPAEAVREAASLIPGATTVELEGADHFPFVGDVDAVIAEVAAFLVGERQLPPPRRLLAAVMFTDLVGSTAHAASIGDADWKSLLDRHDVAVRATVGRCGGTVVKTTGDGVLALLPSAGVAVQAAQRVRDELAEVGLKVRIGLHVGDVDRRGSDVSGIAVNIAARVMAEAGTGEVLMTESVTAAMAGQRATCESVGTQQLRGVPGQWRLFRLGATSR